ncbi:hypothetical protein OC844_007325 [Tilletia horrida]|nr:hypothetical protein OC844_007325 [Tilletia horrida]
MGVPTAGTYPRMPSVPGAKGTSAATFGRANRSHVEVDQQISSMRGPGRYTSFTLIGSGAHGRVFKAADLLAPRPVAAKVFSTRTGSRFPSSAWREIGALCRLRHPCIVTMLDLVLDLGDTDPHLSIILEYAPSDLLQILADNRATLPARKLWAYQLLSALNAVHKEGLVHFDVKPANILLTVHGSAILADFGLAEDIGVPLKGPRTRPVGSLWYRGPEALMRSQTLGPPMDVWAWAVTVFEILSPTGRVFFMRESPVDMMSLIAASLLSEGENRADRELWAGSDLLLGALADVNVAYNDAAVGQRRFRGGNGYGRFYEQTRKTFPAERGIGPIMDCAFLALQLDPRKRPDCQTLLDNKCWTTWPSVFSNVELPTISEKHTHS